MSYVLIVLIVAFSNGSAPNTMTLQMFDVSSKETCVRLGEAMQKRWAGHRRAVDILCEPKEMP